MKLLVVTRENNRDKRYGLAKSLNPILEAFQVRGVRYRYLTQTDLTDRNRRLVLAVIRVGVKLLRCFFRTPNHSVPILFAAIIERLNMGRVAAKIARAEGYTHIHAHDPFIAAGIQFFSRRGTLRQGVTQHGFGSYSQAIHEDGVAIGTRVMGYLRAWERRVLARCHWVISPTQKGVSQLGRDLGVFPAPEHWVAITHPKPRLTVYERHRARQDLNLDPACKYILAVGRIIPLKDFATLMVACKRLQESGPWRLVILGDGDWEATKVQAEDLGLDPESVILTARDDPDIWYSAADIYVSTSQTESFGMANHEALCAGLPCVMTAVAAVPEAAGFGPYYIPDRDPEALMRALQTMLSDEKIRERYVASARDWTVNWPSHDEIAEAYLNAYNGKFQNLPSGPTTQR